MCIGIPMQVTRTEPGHAWVQGRGDAQRIDTALVGEPTTGEWLLVFLGAARERLSAQRAAEVNAVLDLVQASADGLGPCCDEPGFVLPSAMSASDIAALTSSPF